MSNPGKFWDRIAKKYAGQPVKDQASYQKKLDITRTFLKPDMSVLEFGCGTGTTALYHAPVVKHILAIDISQNMLNFAKEKAAQQNITNVEFKKASIDELEPAKASYDVVMGHSIIHLVEDRDVTIRRVHDLLKPEGVFISSTACIGDMFWPLRLIVPIGRALGFFPLVRVFTQKELIKSVEQAGFSIDQVWRPSKQSAIFIVAKKK